MSGMGSNEWDRVKCSPRQIPCFNSNGDNCRGVGREGREGKLGNQRQKKERGTQNRRMGKREGVL